jgi:ribosomal protein uS17
LRASTSVRNEAAHATLRRSTRSLRFHVTKTTFSPTMEELRSRGGAIRGHGTAVDWCFFSADKKCPFTGMVSIRGRILTGTVVSTKMHRTIIIRREYLHYIPKYNRYEKRHKNLAAHVSPAFRVEEGDQVTVGQCRPLSKTVRLRYPSGPKTIPCDATPRHTAAGTDRLVTGAVQRSPCASPDRQGGQEVQQVLKGWRGLSIGHFWRGFALRDLSLSETGRPGRENDCSRGHDHVS